MAPAIAFASAMPQQGHAALFSISLSNLRSRLEASITPSKVTGVIFRPVTYINNKYRKSGEGVYGELKSHQGLFASGARLFKHCDGCGSRRPGPVGRQNGEP